LIPISKTSGGIISQSRKMVHKRDFKDGAKKSIIGSEARKKSV
jgi:hypothetical protein